ncbi:hypothetical protein [Bradyrhizobium retamae]|uniref:Uncharacterized protein n=1 Tax=Bradyrhizobium retamae TaxID=1300035 RepID=A0A0R3MII0_9BRAD|nr:hypothetical protein [Bradyrhizobium retamae]KRR17903.1 hypothetical protein CQ13_11070 [Bradyrhizobium retamae]
MDNKLNEIRRKIRFLRSEMLSAEDNIRKQLNRDEDCSEAAMRLMAMRVTMVGLIGERNRLGGEERLLNVDERLKLDARSVGRKPAIGASERFPAKWEPVRGKKTRQIENPEPRSDSIGAEKARGRRER